MASRSQMLTRFYYSARRWLVVMFVAGVGYYLFSNLARLTRVQAGIIVLIEAALINWAFDGVETTAVREVLYPR
jgi:hypothetical protein